MPFVGFEHVCKMPPTIISPNLRLRWFELSDFDALCRLHADERVVRYLGQGGKPRNANETWRGLTSYLGQWLLLGYGLYAVTDSEGRLLGRAGIYHPHHWPGPEISYVFFPEFWGQNLATQTVSLIRKHIPSGLFPRLVSFIHPENIASIRVAQKNGAVRSGSYTLDETTVEVYEYHDYNALS